MKARRHLIVTADDYGIGPATSKGILYLAAKGVVKGTVLLVNSPFAEQAVESWRRAGQPMELGWHPCLTLDQPVAAASDVPSLVGHDGRFHSLGNFIRRLLLGRIRAADIDKELKAQLVRFRELVGRPPTLVNAHHHIQVFHPIGAILLSLLAKQRPLPYVRRIQEPWSALASVPGAKIKRLVLSVLGRRLGKRQACTDFPGNDWLIGVTDPPCVSDPDFLVRWLRHAPGQVVELTCHPGYLDISLMGRDCTPGDGQLQRRLRELNLLQHESFHQACRQSGFTLIAPSQLRKLETDARAKAA